MDSLKRFGVSIVAFLLALTPTYLAYGVWLLMAPGSFLQRLVLLACLTIPYCIAQFFTIAMFIKFLDEVIF